VAVRTAVFASNDVLTATDLNALAGPWNAYTPTLGGWTIGNGTLSGAYLRFGSLVAFRAELTIGSSTTITATAPTISLPSGASGATGAQIVGSTCDFVDSSAVQRYPAYVRFASGDTSKCQVFALASPLTVLGTTTPFTWAAGDIVRVSGFYECDAGAGLDADSSVPLPEVSHPNTTDTLTRVWDVDEGAWQQVAYDSGWRNMAATVTPPSGMNYLLLQMRRVDWALHLFVSWNQGATSPPSPAFTLTLPAGFRPAPSFAEAEGSFFNAAFGTRTGGWQTLSGGSTINFYAVASQNVRAYLVLPIRSDAVPSSLPGTNALSAPN
jgi:hypothetical protein